MVERFSELIETFAEQKHYKSRELSKLVPNSPPHSFGDDSSLVKLNLLQGHRQPQSLVRQTANDLKGESPPLAEVQLQEDAQ